MPDLISVEEAQKKFELACNEASGFSLMQNAGASFKAGIIVANLREALTDEIMEKFFMPIMNTRVGFLTDRDPKRVNKQGQSTPPYSLDVVRDAIIEGASMGLLPTFNQMNIIAGKMYPTKEGYGALLKKIGAKHVLNIGMDNSAKDAQFSEIPVKVSFEYNGEKNTMLITAVVKKDAYSSYDQLKGKAERRAKKALYEYLTGIDLGDADTDDGGTNTRTVDAEAVVIDQKEAEAKIRKPL